MPETAAPSGVDPLLALSNVGDDDARHCWRCGSNAAADAPRTHGLVLGDRRLWRDRVLQTQRTHEFGVRLALGASSRTMAGRTPGLIWERSGSSSAPGSLAASRLLRSMVFSITPHDPLTFAFSPVILALSPWRRVIFLRRAANRSSRGPREVHDAPTPSSGPAVDSRWCSASFCSARAMIACADQAPPSDAGSVAGRGLRGGVKCARRAQRRPR